MGRRRKFGRPVNGVILIDKAAGMTSSDVVQKAKRLFFASKAGHTGALDPLATGVLPICFGEATKFSQYLLDSDKTYESVFRFGQTTDTGDSDGKVLVESDPAALTEGQVLASMAPYLGDIKQIPPMYSALKKDGRPLYKLARAGIEVEREARPVTIHAYELLEFAPGAEASVKVRISCSKGTYVRSLAEDLGRDLGVGAHVCELRRTQAGDYVIADAQTLESLESDRGEGMAEDLDCKLLSVDSPVTIFPKLSLEDDSAFYFLRGQAVMDTQVYRIAEEGDTVRVFRGLDEFLGLGEVTEDGRIAPKRLVAS